MRKLFFPSLVLIALTAVPVAVHAQDTPAAHDAATVRSFWGEHAGGITDKIAPANKDAKDLYLTLDACGGHGGDGYDSDIIIFLRANNIPATLFINARWADANPETFAELAADPLFKIENHGTKHRAASVSGKYAHGIRGTKSAQELASEIGDNADKIEKLTGRRPTWYRSGAAYYDAESIKIITEKLKIKIAGFAKSLDAGATLPAHDVYRIAMTAKPGDILLAHMNQPTSPSGIGLQLALAELIKRGYTFRQLPD
ncbi:MAG: polysaccharide deacetylase family protein [Proteobacteria bacterium]|nr:polysaccharide deacetylase family protein [Pseudomonadota bacterium]